jgi:hypothetical protein
MFYGDEGWHQEYGDVGAMWTIIGHLFDGIAQLQTALESQINALGRYRFWQY